MVDAYTIDAFVVNVMAFVPAQSDRLTCCTVPVAPATSVIVTVGLVTYSDWSHPFAGSIAIDAPDAMMYGVAEADEFNAST